MDETCPCGKKCSGEDIKSCCGRKVCQKCLLSHFAKHHKSVDAPDYMEETDDAEDA